ncbi:helix-turn-helix transcriptional regulator [Hyphomicrobium sp. CS1BSMeth3]|uniref:helix-turn-helix domain-containing protein n=1 Tax=Hyphomicrobium sp. CS1BSMeth3 TaxID=1892844 RepID=UPI0009319E9C|nr:helix-turn-helix transcriptional regulator [Hyphomicrobium sp. CS1BSMeth3]
MPVSGNQIKAARALIGLEQAELAEKAGVSINTVRNMEAAGADVVRVRSDTLFRVQEALKAAGVIFVEENGDGPGVRMRKKPKPPAGK